MCGICGAVSLQPLSLDKMLTQLTRVNHRGHEAAGLGTITANGTLNHYIGSGPAREACHADQPRFRNFSRQFSIDLPRAFVGHTRYSTIGPSDIAHGQPILMEHPRFGPFFTVHNGQIPDHASFRRQLEAAGHRFITQSDTEVLAAMIAHDDSASLPEAVTSIVQQVSGAFAILVLNRDHLVGARDRHGFWPLWYGQVDDDILLASEQPALGTAISAVSVPPGAAIVINRLAHTVQVTEICPSTPHRCWLDVVYLSRPDEQLETSITSKARFALGVALAQQCPVAADLVVGVPDSGMDAATGYASGTGLAYEPRAIVRNRFAPGRSFLLPGQTQRQTTIHEKLSVTKRLVAGKRVVVVDDSVIRSNTSRQVTDMLRQAGATEVHWRIASPTVKHPCNFGIDIPNCDKLVAAKLAPDDIAAKIGATSLCYLPEATLLEVLNRFQSGWCLACVNGKNPIPVED